MDPSELVKQPQDVTENPYRHSAKDKTDKQKTSFSAAAEEEVPVLSHELSRGCRSACVCAERIFPSVQQPASQFFFDLSRKEGGGSRGRGTKRHSDRGGRGRDWHHDGDGAKQPRRHRESNKQTR